MGIEATTSTISAAAVSSQKATAKSSPSMTNSSDASFKDEMSKVTEKKQEAKTSDKEQKELKSNQKNDAKENKLSASKNKVGKENSVSDSKENMKLESMNIFNNQLSMSNANMMLSNDIAQMIENTVSVNEVNLESWTVGFGDSKQSNLLMSESDADFFINLTQNDSVNVQGITAQANNMINNGAELTEVKQNVQVSQTLLNALSEARENNQPLRIDFDQNISVILRVGRDGAISAQFIPGDKAVEQYLRNNIESLKASFDEQDLPYSELSYSNSSKEQNQRRRQEKQQGE